MQNHNVLSCIKFSFHETTGVLTNRSLLKSFIKAQLLKYNKTPKSIQYVFCNNNFMLELNKSALNHNYYTDIITFDLSEQGKLMAEIYISIDMVKENASNYNVSFKNELHRVIFHGILHLCGIKDKTVKDAKLMRQLEDECLTEYFNTK